MRASSRLFLFASIVISSWGPLHASPEAVSAPPIRAEALGTSLVVAPSVGFESATLRVSGPDGYEAITWSDGGPLIVDLLTEGFRSRSDLQAGAPGFLLDGRYGWEATVHLEGGGQRLESGTFVVDGGSPVSVVSDERRGTAEVAISRGAEGGSGQGLRNVSAAGSTTDDWFGIYDNASDGTSFLHLYSDNGTTSQGGRLDLSNTDGEFRFGNLDASLGQVLKPLMTLEPISPDRARLGLGTVNPQADLHIYSDAGVIRITDSDPCPGTSAWEIEEDSGKLMFEMVPNCDGDPTGGKMWITGGGVGIGTSSPQGNLHVTSASSTNRVRLQAGGGFRDLVTLSDGGFEIQGPGGGAERALRIFPGAADSGLVLRSTGVGIGTDNPQAKLHVLGSAILQGDVALGSSRTYKHTIEPVRGEEILETLRGLPVYSWVYRDDPDQATHVGPMAEEMYAAFRLGRDEKHLSPSDSAGVALAAIQALDRELQALRGRLQGIEEENRSLRIDNASLEGRLARLEATLDRDRRLALMAGFELSGTLAEP